MRIGVLHMDLSVPGARSLKDKRRVVKSLKQRLRNKFNCSVAETDHHDVWGRARLTACVVSTDSGHASAQLEAIVHFAENDRGALLLDYQTEML